MNTVQVPMVETPSSDTFVGIREALVYVPVPNEPDLPFGFPFIPVADRMPAYTALAVLFQFQHKLPNAEIIINETDFPEAPQGFSGIHFQEIPFNLLVALWSLRQPKNPSFFVKASNHTYCGQKRIRWVEQDGIPRWIEEKAPFAPEVGDFVLAYYRPQ